MQVSWIGLVAMAMMSRQASAGVLDGIKLDGWYGKVGLESGIVFARERGSSPLLGGVATLVKANDQFEWTGFQADLLADWNGDRATGARWSFGPEAGVYFYGADVSYFGERVDGETHHGLQVRAKLTVGLVALYVRGAYALRGADESSMDIGMQLKAPVLIKRPKRRVVEVAQIR
ncbi:MAG: hypothetical protein H6Q90_5825 [Deltaproteobacteria bacterium]|nr:hypothetical protein [Deltaproteobacteria bacterium]